MKKLVIFDLDGTLAKSKTSLDAEMSELLQKLLEKMTVAVISGGDWPQFKKQLLTNFILNKSLRNLHILPACGTKLYQYSNSWKKIYSEDLLPSEKEKIIQSLNKASESFDFKIDKTWGDVIDDRGGQITFSALGQRAPLVKKKQWDPQFEKRKKMKTLLDDLIPEFSVRLGGTTSIDVAKLGIDKAYGIRKLRDVLGITLDEMIFVGDALFPGGNDYPAKEIGVTTIQVRNPEETKIVVETINAFK